MAVARYLLVAALLSLAACSSGRGGMPASSVMPEPPQMAGTSEMPEPPDVTDPLDQLTALAAANQAVARAATAGAANSLPVFGDSITQSGNRDDDGVSSDRASTDFDGDRLIASIMRENAAPLSFDTATDTVDSVDLPYISGYTLRTWALVDVTDDGASVSYHLVNWNNADPMDYLAAGYWIHLGGEVQPLQFSDAEAGVFVDGPELSTLTPPVLPESGQLAYGGAAQGFYIGRYGENPVVAEGSTEYGEFIATIQLAADFGAGTIGGCLGCLGGFRVGDLFFVDAASGEQRELGSRVLAHQIRLQAPLSTDGSFRNGRDDGATVTLAAPNAELTASSGTWGGKFSNIPNEAGNPRLVAGTFGASFTTSLGGEGAFLGTFVGLNLP